MAGAIRAGRALLAGQRFDLIYASAPPFSALKVAAALARGSGVPWVAELRDLWTDNHGYAYPAWRRALERRAEQDLLRSARALVTVSGPLAAKLQEGRSQPVWEIRNGCDPEDFDGLPRPAAFDAAPGLLNVVFTGNVYPGHYDVAAFCEGLRRYLEAGGKAVVHVAGRNTAALRQAAEKHVVTPAFRFHATLPRVEALGLQRHADALLFFLWGGASGEGVFSLKLFEYAGAGRPVLAVGPRASGVAGLVEEAGLGIVCADADAVAAQLRALAARKQAGESLERAPRPGFDLTRRSQFARLETRLAGVAAGTGG